MKRETQRTSNPYPYSDSNKRYQTFDYYLRSLFGEKCAKISLDAGFTCPNKDGKKSYGGCIYCASGSSGAQCRGPLADQYEKGRQVMTDKWDCKAFIPYLQAHTNTYAPIEVLKTVYDECASFDGAVMLAVATRADCLSDEVISLLNETKKKIPLMIELGLQSTNDKTATLINRAHTFDDFAAGLEKLKGLGERVKTCVHLINGLPGETYDDMIESAVTVGKMHPDVIKLHLLHVLKGTPLASMYLSGDYVPMEKDAYVKTVCDQIERIPPDIALGRITGDGIKDMLLAPAWSTRKTGVANDIDKELFRRQTYQGIYA